MFINHNSQFCYYYLSYIIQYIIVILYYVTHLILETRYGICVIKLVND